MRHPSVLVGRDGFELLALRPVDQFHRPDHYPNAAVNLFDSIHIDQGGKFIDHHIPPVTQIVGRRAVNLLCYHLLVDVRDRGRKAVDFAGVTVQVRVDRLTETPKIPRKGMEAVDHLGGGAKHCLPVGRGRILGQIVPGIPESVQSVGQGVVARFGKERLYLA